MSTGTTRQESRSWDCDLPELGFAVPRHPYLINEVRGMP